jgi:hypothetical protein
MTCTSTTVARVAATGPVDHDIALPSSITKREFWRRRRAIERDLMVNDRFDDLVDNIPRSILWEAL